MHLSDGETCSHNTLFSTSGTRCTIRLRMAQNTTSLSIRVFISHFSARRYRSIQTLHVSQAGGFLGLFWRIRSIMRKVPAACRAVLKLCCWDQQVMVIMIDFLVRTHVACNRDMIKFQVKFTTPSFLTKHLTLPALQRLEFLGHTNRMSRRKIRTFATQNPA
jgi:hypothetical protein